MAEMKIVAPKEAYEALTQLLDMAVKHAGLQVAEVAVFWNRKIQDAEEVKSPPVASKSLDVNTSTKPVTEEEDGA